jgi:putative DNA primase/helicase
MNAKPSHERACVPDELKALRHWVVWKYEPRPGKDKPAKAPYQPRTGHRASHANPATWGTYAQARARAQQGGWQGLGFVFTAEDPYCGIDLDGCRDLETEEIAPWAGHIVEQMQSYTEVSPSGRGLHLLVKAALPDHAGRKRGPLEVYDAQRYFTVTGEHLAGTPAELEERQAELLALYATLAPVEEAEALPRAACPVSALSYSDEEVLRRALAAPNGAKFQALWSGDLRAYTDLLAGQGDQSRADFALCLRLSYWCNGDAEQMDRLFRQSALYRSKWDVQMSGQGHTYEEVTIWNAVRRHEQLLVAPTRRRR